MECVLLGTGGMMPMPDRLLTSLVVRLGGKSYLFDAGEGVQLGLKRRRVGVRGLDLIALSHLHADHCLGLFGLMMLRAQMADPDPLTIVGPPGTKRFVSQVQSSLDFFINYPVEFVEWSEDRPGVAYEDSRVQLFWHPVEHTRFCLGYRLEERERPGKFDPKRARALRIPEGPLWGQLQGGQQVEVGPGNTVAPDQVVGAPRPGRKVAYVVDTRPCKGIYRLCQGVDLAFIEGMFLPEHADQAAAKQHLTAADAARIAGRAAVKRAVLVHISPRYDEEAVPLLEAAAKERFAGAEMGRELSAYTVRYDDDT